MALPRAGWDTLTVAATGELGACSSCACQTWLKPFVLDSSEHARTLLRALASPMRPLTMRLRIESSEPCRRGGKLPGLDSGQLVELCPETSTGDNLSPQLSS